MRTLVALLGAAGLVLGACGAPTAAPSAQTSATASAPGMRSQIFVFSNSSPSVTVIDGQSHKVLRTKDLPDARSWTWTWNDDNNYFDGQRLWLGRRDPASGRVEVVALDLDTLEIVQRIALGTDPLTLYIGKATRPGTLLVGKMGSGQVAAIDTHAAKVLWTKPVPVNGDVVCDADIATLPDGTQRFFYPTRKGDTLVALDPTSGRTLQVAGTPEGATPLMLTVAPGGKVWVQESGSNTNAVFDPATLALIRRFPAAKGPIVATFSPDGKLAYLGHSVDPVVDVFDTASYALLRRISVGATPDRIAVDPSGRFVFAEVSKEAAVAVIDTSTWKVSERIPLGTNPSGIFARRVGG